MKTIFRGVIEDGPFGGNGGGGWTDGGEVHLNGHPSALDVRYTWIWFYSWYQVYLDTLLLLISGKPGYTSTLDVRYTWKHFYPLISVIPGCNSTLDIMYTWIHFYPWYQAYLDTLLLLISCIPGYTSTLDIRHTWMHFYSWYQVYLSSRLGAQYLLRSC